MELCKVKCAMRVRADCGVVCLWIGARCSWIVITPGWGDWCWIRCTHLLLSRALAGLAADAPRPQQVSGVGDHGRRCSVRAPVHCPRVLGGATCSHRPSPFATVHRVEVQYACCLPNRPVQPSTRTPHHPSVGSPPPTAPHQLAGLGMANGCHNHGYHLLEWRLAQGVAEGCGQGDGGQGGVSARRCHGCASVLWCRRTPRSSCGIPLRRGFRSAFIEFRRARGCGRVLESSHVFCSASCVLRGPAPLTEPPPSRGWRLARYTENGSPRCPAHSKRSLAAI